MEEHLADSNIEGLMERERSIPDNSAIKMLCSFFAGIILAGLGAFFAYPHDLPTKADIASMQTNEQTQLDKMVAQQTLEQDEVTTLRVNMARIMLKLNIPDSQ